MDDQLDSIEDFVARIKKYNPHRTEDHIKGNILNNIKQLPNGKWTWKYDSHLRTEFNNRSKTNDSVESWKVLEKIIIPTLIVKGGKSDILSSEVLHKMSKTMSNATSKTVEDAGHLVPGDKPIEFTKLVIDFLS